MVLDCIDFCSLPSLLGSECSDFSLVTVPRDIFKRHTLYLSKELSVIMVLTFHLYIVIEDFENALPRLNPLLLKN